MINGLTKNDSETIGFVVACLFNEAISRDDLHDWCVYVISENDAVDTPPYIFDLLEYKDSLAKIFTIVGFVPKGVEDDSERMALKGIAVARGRVPFELDIAPEDALDSLRNQPRIRARFSEVFPFISLCSS